MLASAEQHDVYLDTDVEVLQQTASDEDIVYLSQCGVGYSDEFDCLYMFV
jgi:hypothetical protein